MSNRYDGVEELIEYKRHGVSNSYTAGYNDKNYLEVNFQVGPTADHPKDGAFIEELLVVAVAKLEEYNKHLPSRENSLAITKIEEAIMWLDYRKRERESRDVYGTNKP